MTPSPTRALLPYPGLRPFERHEANVFFGRERQVDAMVDRLARHRLLAVTGGSGCGKSSLVRAGLLEALETGLLAAAGPVWRFATLRPSGHPMTELATALVAALGGLHTSDDVALRRAGLERGPLSLLEELRERPLPDDGNLLILVDQFEELFRYRSLAGREEAEAFVALLLASAAQDAVPIHVVLTMRSDFLGRCADFDGLAEAVSDAQYLCPRLSRDQIRAAIEGPAQVFGGNVELRLVSRIVNDMGTDPDQLPLMQHALMRLWELARTRAPDAPQLLLDDYEAEGGIKGSLSRHADEILAEIRLDTPERADTARRLFCLLVEGEAEKAVRRLASVTEIIAVTGKPLDEIAAVADPFRAPGRSLLMPASERPLAQDTVLDISHESLIRQWQTLRDWVRAEAAFAEHYRDIERRARRWSAGSAGFLDGIDLDVALAWREREQATAPWAVRYGGDFTLTTRYLDESRNRRDRLTHEAAEERAAADRRLKERLEEAQRHQSRFLTEKAREALRGHQLETSTLIALAALPADLNMPERPVWVPAISTLAEARSQDRQRAVLLGHTGSIRSAAFSPDGARIVTASGDKTARLWDAATGAPLAVLHGHTDGVAGAAFSPDGTRIVTASDDDTARLWDAATGASLAVLKEHAFRVKSAIFSSDGARIATLDLFTARLWDAVRGAPVAELRGHKGPVRSAEFSPDGARVVTASDDHTARLWDAATGAPLAVLEGHTGSVYRATFKPDGAQIVTESDDNTARLWDGTTGAPLGVRQGLAVVGAFSPDGARTLTFDTSHSARLWDTETGASLAVLQGHTNSIASAVFSPDGARVVTTSYDGTARLWHTVSGASFAVLAHAGWVRSAVFSQDGTRVVTGSDDQTARVWDANSDLSLAVLQGHTKLVTSAAFSPNGAQVLTASDDHTARLWNVESGTLLAVLEGHTGSIFGAAFSPDGARVVTASDDGTARLWDAATGASLAVLQGHTRTVYSAAFSPDGERIVTAGDNTARLWDAISGASFAVLRANQFDLTSAAFSPDGARIVTTSYDQTARLWDATTGASLAVLQGHTRCVNRAAFSPDGTRVVTASDDGPARLDGTARLWDAATGALLAVLPGHTSFFREVAFSPDGARLVTTCYGHAAGLWDVATAALLGVLQGHTDTVRSAVYSPDGARIVTASDDGTARLWDAATGVLLAVLHGHTGSVHSAAFSPDGARIVTSGDNTARLWNAWPLLTADTIAYAGFSALRALSREEQASLYLTDVDPAAGQKSATADDPASEGGRLGGDPLDPHNRMPGVLFDAIAYRALAELDETGDHPPQDLEKALFNYAVAARLFEEAGDEHDAVMARARRGSLARALAPEIAVRVARQAAAWQPKGS